MSNERFSKLYKDVQAFSETELMCFILDLEDRIKKRVRLATIKEVLPIIKKIIMPRAISADRFGSLIVSFAKRKYEEIEKELLGDEVVEK